MNKQLCCFVPVQNRIVLNRFDEKYVSNDKIVYIAVKCRSVIAVWQVERKPRNELSNSIPFYGLKMPVQSSVLVLKRV